MVQDGCCRNYCVEDHHHNFVDSHCRNCRHHRRCYCHPNHHRPRYCYHWLENHQSHHHYSNHRHYHHHCSRDHQLVDCSNHLVNHLGRRQSYHCYRNYCLPNFHHFGDCHPNRHHLGYHDH